MGMKELDILNIINTLHMKYYYILIYQIASSYYIVLIFIQTVTPIIKFRSLSFHGIPSPLSSSSVHTTLSTPILIHLISPKSQYTITEDETIPNSFHLLLPSHQGGEVAIPLSPPSYSHC